MDVNNIGSTLKIKRLKSFGKVRQLALYATACNVAHGLAFFTPEEERHGDAFVGDVKFFRHRPKGVPCRTKRCCVVGLFVRHRNVHGKSKKTASGKQLNFDAITEPQ